MSNVFASMVISVKRAGFKKHKVICHFCPYLKVENLVLN